MIIVTLWTSCFSSKKQYVDPGGWLLANFFSMTVPIALPKTDPVQDPTKAKIIPCSVLTSKKYTLFKTLSVRENQKENKDLKSLNEHMKIHDGPKTLKCTCTCYMWSSLVCCKFVVCMKDSK